MRKKNLLILGILVLFSLTFINAEIQIGTSGDVGVDLNIPTPINYTLVNVNDSNYFQGNTPTTLKDWIQELFNSIYCKLTGCTMTGNLNISNANLTLYNSGTDVLFIDSATGEFTLRGNSTSNLLHLYNTNNDGWISIDMHMNGSDNTIRKLFTYGVAGKDKLYASYRGNNYINSYDNRGLELQLSGFSAFTIFNNSNTCINCKKDYIAQEVTNSLLVVGDVNITTNLTLSGADSHLILPQVNDASTPTLAFGDGDTGFYESADDTLFLKYGNGAYHTIFNYGYIQTENNNAWRLVRATATDTQPTLIPMSNDADTGIGHAGVYTTDQLSLIAGAVEGMRITESASAIDVNINGDLFIGDATTAPLVPLHLEGTPAGAAFMRVKYSGGKYLTLGVGTSGAEWVSDGLMSFQSTGSYVKFMDSTGEVVRITGGNVGINTSTPQNTLNVVGDLNVTGIIYNDAIYCESSELVDQEFADAGVRYRINISNVDEGNGIGMATGNNGTNITIDTSGVYHLVAQPQVKAGAGGAGDFHMWIEKFNSTGWFDIPDSNIELKLSSLEEDVIVLATTLKLNQGEKLRLVASVSDNKILLHAQSPAGEPVIPSIIFTMYRIGN